MVMGRSEYGPASTVEEVFPKLPPSKIGIAGPLQRPWRANDAPKWLSVLFVGGRSFRGAAALGPHRFSAEPEVQLPNGRVHLLGEDDRVRNFFQ